MGQHKELQVTYKTQPSLSLSLSLSLTHTHTHTHTHTYPLVAQLKINIGEQTEIYYRH
jgi:predicted glycoside hydrolase/deacetylase ChbG (UPF0249 family)